MSNGDLNWITNFIWGIADDVLRDLYVRGKYRDVILPIVRPTQHVGRAFGVLHGFAQHPGGHGEVGAHHDREVLGVPGQTLQQVAQD